MDIVLTEILQRFVHTCNDGWLLGWHEHNGGFLIYRMKPEEVEQCRPAFKKGREMGKYGCSS